MCLQLLKIKMWTKKELQKISPGASSILRKINIAMCGTSNVYTNMSFTLLNVNPLKGGYLIYERSIKWNL